MGKLKDKPPCFGTATTQDTCLQCEWNPPCCDETYKRLHTEREDKVKAITFIITLPCGPARNEKWAEHTSWGLVRNLPRGASVRWMWELDKGE